MAAGRLGYLTTRAHTAMAASIVLGATYRWHRHLGGGWGWWMRASTRVSIGKHLRAWDEKAKGINNADVAELVDARDLKSLDGNVVWVRVPPPAPAFAREASEGCRAEADRRRRALCWRATAWQATALKGYAWRS